MVPCCGGILISDQADKASAGNISFMNGMANAEILSVQSEYQEELKITLQKLEDAKLVELAQIKSDDPDATKKKAEINQRYQLSEGQARVETEQKTQQAVFNISQSFLQLIKDAQKEHDNEVKKTTDDYLNAQLEKYQGYANAVIDIWGKINAVKNAKDEAAFNKESARTDKLKKTIPGFIKW